MFKKKSKWNWKIIEKYGMYLGNRLVIAFLITVMFIFGFIGGIFVYCAIKISDAILKERLIWTICVFASIEIIIFIFAIFCFFELSIYKFLDSYETDIQDKITIKFRSKLTNYSFYENYKDNVYSGKIINFIRKKIKNRKKYFWIIIGFISLIIIFSLIESISLVNNDWFAIFWSIIIFIAGIIFTNWWKWDKKENKNNKINYNDFLTNLNDFIVITKNYNNSDIYNYKLKFPIYLINKEWTNEELLLEIINWKEYINKVIFFNNILWVYFLNHWFDCTVKLWNKNKRKQQNDLIKEFISNIEKIKDNFDNNLIDKYYDDYENFLNKFIKYSTYFESRKIKKIFSFLFLNFNINDVNYNWNEIYSLNKYSNNLFINYYQLNYLEYLFSENNLIDIKDK